MNSNFKFFKQAYEMGSVDDEYLKSFVITETNPYGYITPLEFEQITNIEFK